MNLVNISIDGVQFYSEQGTYTDLIFNSNHSAGETETVSRQTKDYLNPDYTMHVYSTEPHIYMIHKNNLIAPVRQRTMNNTYELFEIGEISKGVYITEIFTIHNTYYVTDYLFISEYLARNNIKYDKKQIQGIKNKISKEFYMGHDGGVPIRIVTFIPYQEIVDNGKVYNKALDMVFTHNIVDHNISHPHHEDPYDDVEAEQPSGITAKIDIISSNNPHHKYYIQIGGKIQTVLSKTTSEQKDGCYIKYYKGGVLTESVIMAIDDMPSHGIYENLVECKAHGDVALATKLKTLELSEMRLKHQTVIEESKKQDLQLKQAHEVKMRDIDIHKKEIELALKKSDIVMNAHDNEYKISTQHLDSHVRMAELEHKEVLRGIEYNIKKADVEIANSKIDIKDIDAVMQQRSMMANKYMAELGIYDKMLNIVDKKQTYRAKANEREFDSYMKHKEWEYNKIKYNTGFIGEIAKLGKLFI